MLTREELFRLHDLNGNGFLEEAELVQLNAKAQLATANRNGNDILLDKRMASTKRHWITMGRHLMMVLHYEVDTVYFV